MYVFIFIQDGVVAHMVERPLRMREAAGSIPVGSRYFFDGICLFFNLAACAVVFIRRGVPPVAHGNSTGISRCFLQVLMRAKAALLSAECADAVFPSPESAVAFVWRSFSTRRQARPSCVTDADNVHLAWVCVGPCWTSGHAFSLVALRYITHARQIR